MNSIIFKDIVSGTVATTNSTSDTAMIFTCKTDHEVMILYYELVNVSSVSHTVTVGFSPTNATTDMVIVGPNGVNLAAGEMYAPPINFRKSMYNSGQLRVWADATNVIKFHFNGSERRIVF